MLSKNKESSNKYILQQQAQYIDITKKIHTEAKTKKGKVIKQRFLEYNGEIFYIDGHNVVYKHDKREIDVARIMCKTFGGDVKILPNINYPQGIKSADYIFRGEFIDLKRIKSKRMNDSVKTALRNEERQAHNFIIDNTEQTIKDDDVIRQVKEIYNSKKFLWVDKIYILKENKFIKAFKRR